MLQCGDGGGRVDRDSQRPWPRAARDALASGSAASIASAIVLSICSAIEEDAPAGALNGPSQWLWGESEAFTRRATLKHTAVGYLIHHASSIFWAFLHERAFGGAAKSATRHCIEAAATTATAYVIDYRLTPRRLRPGFRKHLGPLSMFAVYAAFAAGLAAAAIVRQPDGAPGHGRHAGALRRGPDSG
jgi:hypothetical protein